MIDDECEWDDDKATRNLTQHGLSFDIARRVFRDTSAVGYEDTREDYGEDRSVLIGMVQTDAGRQMIVTVVYTEREHRKRIISAWEAERDEQDAYYTQDADDIE
jgi:uncharacterized DUF497 family protein